MEPSFEEYTLRVALAIDRHSGVWRTGQAAFNVLVDMRPDLSEQIRATPLDPYHLDERLPDFYEYVRSNW